MGYKEAYRQAQEEGTLIDMTPELIKFSTEGQTEVGKLISIKENQSRFGEGGQTYRLYTVKTDERLIIFPMGQVSDQRYEGMLKPGEVYAFVYKGKEKTAQGTSFNNFEVVRIPISEPDEEPIPF